MNGKLQNGSRICIQTKVKNIQLKIREYFFCFIWIFFCENTCSKNDLVFTARCIREHLTIVLVSSLALLSEIWQNKRSIRKSYFCAKNRRANNWSEKKENKRKRKEEAIASTIHFYVWPLSWYSNSHNWSI